MKSRILVAMFVVIAFAFAFAPICSAGQFHSRPVGAIWLDGTAPPPDPIPMSFAARMDGTAPPPDPIPMSFVARMDGTAPPPDPIPM